MIEPQPAPHPLTIIISALRVPSLPETRSHIELLAIFKRYLRPKRFSVVQGMPPPLFLPQKCVCHSAIKPILSPTRCLHLGPVITLERSNEAHEHQTEEQSGARGSPNSREHEEVRDVDWEVRNGREHEEVRDVNWEEQPGARGSPRDVN